MKPTRKILFVIVCLDPSPFKTAENFFIRALPFGVLGIISYCKKHVYNYNIDFSILEIYINDESIENKLMERVNEFKPDIVAFSVMFNHFCPEIFRLSKVIKENKKEIFTIAGGIGISDTYDEFFNYTENIDAICFSEGELPVSALLNADNLFYMAETHKSWLTPGTVKNGKKPAYDLLDNINEIPPFYHLINIKDYVLETISRKNGNTIKMFPMVTTRGCPYSCNFCSASYRSGKKVRSFSADRIISDINNIIKYIDIDMISFRDDQFLLDKNRAITILKYIAEIGKSASPEGGINISLMDEEIAYWFKQTNVTQVSLPVESGSERMLKEIIKKPLDLKQVKPVVDLLRKYDIVTTGNFICGMPGETPEDRKLTEEFIEDTGFNGVTFFVATPLKGTRLYDECIKSGYINNTNIFDKKSFFNGYITAPYIEPVKINKYSYYLNLKYNFIKNYDYLHGNFEKAEIFFKRVSELDPNHAISHYYLAKIYNEFGNKELKDKYINMYKKIIKTDKLWREYALAFDLEID
ncbi:MAG: B12-binding domain-containing radical SAM protein [Treponema sp.]|jgi:radical SAM superfamily enzyme YgiQ (UPF0313 family)|nr:B12-binding domain-containing radical SAM protein [Treponema sp.]